MSGNPLLKTPGEMINEAREAQDLTIAQLSERTKIPPPVLVALELDEYHKISGPLYIKSFLQTCAVDLGLDPLVVLSMYNKISGEKKSGPAGSEMVWDEEEVKISKVGLPWLRIIMLGGIVAVLVGLGLFTLRGCGNGGSDPEEGPQVALDRSESKRMATAVVLGDSVTDEGSRRESLIPARTEADLQAKTVVPLDVTSSGSVERHEPSASLDDTLALGWMLNPTPSNAETEDSAVDNSIGELPVQENAVEKDTIGKDSLGKETHEVEAAEEAPMVSTDQEQEIIKTESVVVSQEDLPAEIVAEAPPAAVTTPIEKEPEESQVAVPAVSEIDSAWPLVLRIVCDAPQMIQVKRDGDREFSEVRWPEKPESAPAVPDAGFEAGRAYRLGERLVVFWGAEDHFSLKLARVRGVEVSINGRLRDVGRLRPGQELILDSHFAGSTPRR